MTTRIDETVTRVVGPGGRGAAGVGAGVGQWSAARRLAPFRLRCGALLVDYTALVLVLAVATLFARVLGAGARWAGETALAVGYAAALALVAFNFVVLPAFGGRTLGKWVTGLRVERLDGSPLGPGRACLRHLVGYPVSLLTLALGFLLAAFTRDGRALHDYVAGTVVVRDRGRAARRSAAARRPARA